MELACPNLSIIGVQKVITPCNRSRTVRKVDRRFRLKRIDNRAQLKNESHSKLDTGTESDDSEPSNRNGPTFWLDGAGKVALSLSEESVSSSNELPLPALFQSFLQSCYQVIADVNGIKESSRNDHTAQNRINNIDWNSNAPCPAALNVSHRQQTNRFRVKRCKRQKLNQPSLHVSTTLQVRPLEGKQGSLEFKLSKCPSAKLRGKSVQKMARDSTAFKPEQERRMINKGTSPLSSKRGKTHTAKRKTSVTILCVFFSVLYYCYYLIIRSVLDIYIKARSTFV